MKRIFKRFLNYYPKRISYVDLTIRFNTWVSEVDQQGWSKNLIYRIPMKAYTNKFMIRKWCEKLNIQVTNKI